MPGSTGSIILLGVLKRGVNATSTSTNVSTEAGNVIVLVSMLVSVMVVIGVIIYIIASPRGIPCCPCQLGCCGKYPDHQNHHYGALAGAEKYTFASRLDKKL